MTDTTHTLRAAAEAAGWDCYQRRAADGHTRVHVFGPMGVAHWPDSTWTVRIEPGRETAPFADLRRAIRAAYEALDSRAVQRSLRPVLQAAGALPTVRDLPDAVDDLLGMAHEADPDAVREALELVDRIRWAFEDLT